MKKIFIIDDNYASIDNRGEVYNSVLEDKFEIVDVLSQPNFHDLLDTTTPDLYLVDIVLTDMIDPLTLVGMETLPLLKRLNRSIPVVLLSSEYEQLVSESKFTPLLNQLTNEGINVKYFFTWSQFFDAHNMASQEKKEAIAANLIYHIMSSEKERIKETLASNKYDFAVITALTEEMKPFRDLVENNLVTTNLHGITLAHGALELKSGKTASFILATQNRMGMVDAAILGSTLLAAFKIRNLFMIGVCGGRVGEGGTIGSMIIPSHSSTFQGGKIDNGKFLLDSATAEATGSIISSIVNNSRALQETLDDIVKSYIDSYFKTHKKSIPIDRPSILTETMACGDIVISEPDLLNKIANDIGQRKLAGLEMESYSVLRLANYFPGVNVSVMKSVMDDTEYKSDRNKELAAYISANFLYNLIQKEIIKIKE